MLAELVEGEGMVISASIAAIPATIGAIAGMMSARRARHARDELRPNGGTSTRDVILGRLDNLDAGAAALAAEVKGIASRLDVVERQLAPQLPLEQEAPNP